ncbi:variant erythrocyte surface antigen beta subunit, putative [Babesia ovis]|uniref:Variant erythrocyte surface antigen beta subunit, putative n=1 Tax=Babesia ovis TaxID=5869 RepID=A0A9W5TCZ5_BABOV|nr:variant erythrocyte surface antigen beta subunit, putative [Babesia ovis]
MQFYFSYPMSETQSYYLLQDCLVALYYQLYFLRLQCDWEYKEGNGWGYCKYGEGVDCTDCKSWICKKGGQGGHGGAKDSDSSSNKCGTSTQSPLQAFLTDCLPGFTCDSLTSKEGKKKLDELRDKTKSGQQVDFKTYSECYPPFLEHRNHLPVGQECAVPMGFSGSFKGAPAPGKDMIGLGINAVLAYYATSNMETASLYQITRCICSLTRRVPRSTGTLFGFFYYFAKMCDTSSSSGNNNGNGKEVSKALSEELLCCPGWREPDDLMKALKDWGKGSHKNGECSCLDSLHNCKEGSEKPSSGGNTCGYYLRALTGNLYNSLATQFTETYVSWIIHLTGLLEAGLRKLLEEFKMIKCSKDIGCKGPSGKGGCTCDTMCKGGPDGQHGEKCCCANVVDCVGVHGLFYRFGFTYDGPGWLVWNDAKRQCKDFHDQLGKVIGGNLFKELSNQLRKFMYSTRALFGVYIGVYWTAVIVYLLWSMTVNLDLIHIQSHWRSPRSYLVPLQRILAHGSRNVKRVCTIGYFQEETGDRLLSQGVSDVYL